MITDTSRQFYNGISCDAMEDGSIKRSCHEALLIDKEHIRCASLLHIASCDAIKPQDLIKSKLFGFHRGLEAARIVTACLGLTGAAFSSTHIFIFDKNFDRMKPTLVVGSNRSKNNIKIVMGGGF